MMKWFQLLVAILLCLACNEDPMGTIIIPPTEETPKSSVPLSDNRSSTFCYSEQLRKNTIAYYFDSPSTPNQVIRNPSQDWISNYFEPQIENKQFYHSVSFPSGNVAIRLFIPGEDSTRIRQAFISESEIFKYIGSDSYSLGYLYPPNQELQISWDFTDSLGTRVTPGWYAFCTEFVEENRAILFWFKLVE